MEKNKWNCLVWNFLQSQISRCYFRRIFCVIYYAVVRARLRWCWWHGLFSQHQLQLWICKMAEWGNEVQTEREKERHTWKHVGNPLSVEKKFKSKEVFAGKGVLLQSFYRKKCVWRFLICRCICRVAFANCRCNRTSREYLHVIQCLLIFVCSGDKLSF